MYLHCCLLRECCLVLSKPHSLKCPLLLLSSPNLWLRESCGHAQHVNLAVVNFPQGISSILLKRCHNTNLVTTEKHVPGTSSHVHREGYLRSALRAGSKKGKAKRLKWSGWGSMLKVMDKRGITPPPLSVVLSSFSFFFFLELHRWEKELWSVTWENPFPTLTSTHCLDGGPATRNTYLCHWVIWSVCQPGCCSGLVDSWF